MADLLSDAYSQFDQFYLPLDWDDPRRIPLNDRNVRGTDFSCVQVLQQGIELSVETHSTQFFTGFIGSGKSSELKELAHQLEGQGYQVVFVDTEEFLNLKLPPTISDLLVTVAGGMDKHLRDALPPEALKPATGFWARLNSFAQSIQIDGITLGAEGVASVGLSFKQNVQFRQKLNAALQELGRVPAFAKECGGFLREAVGLLRKQAPASKGVVVIVDSFEKVGTPYITQEVVRAVETLFTRDWNLLQVPCHAIYTVPPWLAFVEFGAASPALMLPMCKLRHRKGGKEFPPGIRAMLDILEKRAPLAQMFAQHAAVLKPVILASGGYPRDVLRMMREVILRVSLEMKKSQALKLPLPRHIAARIVKRVIEVHTELYEDALTEENLPFVVQVARDRDIEGQRHEDLPRVVALFQHHFVMTYLNGARWFDIHPLVRRSAKLQKALKAQAGFKRPE
jgi:hypothetical protein